MTAPQRRHDVKGPLMFPMFLPEIAWVCEASCGGYFHNGRRAVPFTMGRKDPEWDTRWFGEFI